MTSKFSSAVFEQEFLTHGVSGWEICALQETVSTMQVARERILASPITSPFLAVAESQQGGRGRQGRVWSSTPGGFYATYVLPSDSPMAELGGFSLAVGVVIRRALQAAGVSLSLKWPNDLVAADGKKLGGILIEVLPQDGRSLLLVGIGVNFDNQIDTSMATSVRRLGASALSLVEFSSRLASGLSEALVQFESSGLSSFMSEWRSSDYLLGRMVEIDDGHSTLQGVVAGISDQGALLLERDGSIAPVWSGHILSIR